MAGRVANDQLILVFVKYVNEDPAELNKAANGVIRRSVEAVGLVTFTPLRNSQGASLSGIAMSVIMNCLLAVSKAILKWSKNPSCPRTMTSLS